MVDLNANVGNLAGRTVNRISANNPKESADATVHRGSWRKSASEKFVDPHRSESGSTEVQIASPTPDIAAGGPTVSCMATISTKGYRALAEVAPSNRESDGLWRSRGNAK